MLGEGIRMTKHLRVRNIGLFEIGPTVSFLKLETFFGKLISVSQGSPYAQKKKLEKELFCLKMGPILSVRSTKIQ